MLSNCLVLECYEFFFDTHTEYCQTVRLSQTLSCLSTYIFSIRSHERRNTNAGSRLPLPYREVRCTSFEVLGRES